MRATLPDMAAWWGAHLKVSMRILGGTTGSCTHINTEERLDNVYCARAAR